MTTQFVNAVVFASVGFWVGAAVWVVKSAWARVGLLALAGAQVGIAVGRIIVAIEGLKP